MDREKVIKGLAYCTRPSEVGKGGNFCMDCPYTEPIGFNQFKCNGQQMMGDALALLKEQEAKWDEDKQGEVCRLIRCSNCGLTFIVGNNIPYDEWIEDRNYCRRCGARMVKPND